MYGLRRLLHQMGVPPKTVASARRRERVREKAWNCQVQNCLERDRTWLHGGHGLELQLPIPFHYADRAESGRCF